jgi:hypothetical protein
MALSMRVLCVSCRANPQQQTSTSERMRQRRKPEVRCDLGVNTMPRMIPRHSCISANIFEAMKRIVQNTAFWGVSVSGTGMVSDE